MCYDNSDVKNIEWEVAVVIQLSAFADEAASDYSTQLQILREERIPYIELRGLDGKNISDISENEAEQYAMQTQKAGIKVWSIGSPLGKIGIHDDFKSHMKLAKHIFQLAKIFGTEKVRVFSFYTKEPAVDRDEVLTRMRALAEMADKNGVVLYHENEKEIYGDIAERCVDLLRTVPQLRSVFDPANYVQCGEDVSAALIRLADRTDYYHIKDALYSDGEVVPAGLGDGKLKEVLGCIHKDTTLTLEPHLTVFEGYSHLEHTSRKVKYGYKTSREAFAVATEALRTLLSDEGFHEEREKWIK